MQAKLREAIAKFEKAPSSLEAYIAIAEFVERVTSIPDYLESVNRAGDVIYDALVKTYTDKQDESRGEKYETIHQLDPVFPLRNLVQVRTGLQDVLSNKEWLFRFFQPDDPMPASDKREYLLYLNKVYAAALPFLDEASQPIDLTLHGYDEEKRVLTIGRFCVSIAKHAGNNNAHEVMAYLFLDKKEELGEKVDYSEIAETRFGAEFNARNKYAHQPYSGACDRINNMAKDGTNGLVPDLLIFNRSNTGHVQVNPKYV